MKKTAKRTREGQEGTRGFALAALMDARTTLHDAVIHAGLAVLGGLLEDDRAKLCGPRYGREAERRTSGSTGRNRTAASGRSAR